LARMVRQGLAVLSDNDHGFVLQIEAGRIDHANHANDPGGMVWDLLAADDALAEVMAYVDAHPQTLLIFASDHGTGGGAIFGAGAGYRQSSLGLSFLTQRRASTEHMLKSLGKTPDADALIAVAWDCAGVKLTRTQADALAHAIVRETRLPHPTAHTEQPYNALHLELSSGDKLNPDRLTISYATGAHTAGPVPYAVYGAGSEYLPRGLVDNTDMFTWMTDALRIDHRNPPMTEARALRHLASSELLQTVAEQQ
jgi:alkaline phosphatase